MAARETVDGIVRGEVSGITAVWPEGRRTGSASAMLMFRVGQADETLPTRGITHLLEHLALFPTGQQPHGYNGQTGPTITSFGMQGKPGELVEFFAQLGRSLQELPLDRLEVERGVLATEEQGHNGNADNLWRLRWGPRGYGLIGYTEFGAQRVTGAALRDWSREWFTRDNAVLVLDGAPPRGLKIDLPEGDWHPAPEPLPSSDPLPLSFAMRGESFGLSLVRTRATGTGDASWLLHERLNQRLRHQLGLVYGVNGSSVILTPELRHDTFWTHALPEKLANAGTALIDLLAEIDAPMTTAEKAQWSAFRKRNREGRAQSAGTAGWASYVGEELLLGTVPTGLEQLTKETSKIREADVLRNVRAALESAALALPDGVDGTRVATPVTEWSSEALTGRTLTNTHGQREELVLAEKGITLLLLPARDPVTVHFDDVAGVLAWDDGARTLLGNDGFTVAYRPELWGTGSADVIRHIDSRIDPSLMIGQGSRKPIQKPTAAAGAAAPVKASALAKQPSWVRRVAAVVPLVLGALTLLSAISEFASPDPTETRSQATSTGITLLVFTAVILFFPVRRAWKKRRPKKP